MFDKIDPEELPYRDLEDLRAKPKPPRKIRRIKMNPTQILVLGFMVVILIGAVLLTLPVSSRSGNSTSFLDALFTSTSAVCVTGLVVVNSAQHWSIFGKVVIMLLIQVGGLGFMTLATSFFIILGRKISLKERLIIQEAMNQSSLSGMVRLIRNVVIGTFIIEGIGAILLFVVFLKDYPLIEAAAYGIFHSISAFCNAGFDILGPNSLSPYVGDTLLNLVVMALIILGGVGFTVWVDVIQTNKYAKQRSLDIRHWFMKLSLHTKLVLILTLAFNLIGFIVFFLLEMNNPETLKELSVHDKVLSSMFLSISPRTAGFNTIDITGLTDSSKFITIILMFIGGSPAGTAGGIKTVTVGVLFFSVLSIIRNQTETEVFERRLPDDLIRRALAVVMIGLSAVVFVTVVLSISEGLDFLDTSFEAVSAFGTVGLSLGVTPQLSSVGKIVISLTMFLGRLGPMTLAVALAIRSGKKKANIRRPEERVMVG